MAHLLSKQKEGTKLHGTYTTAIQTLDEEIKEVDETYKKIQALN